MATRYFGKNKEMFHLESEHRVKDRAQEVADRLRRDGYKVRIIPGKFKYEVWRSRYVK